MGQHRFVTPMALACLLATALVAVHAAAVTTEKVHVQLAVRGVAAYPAYVARHLGYFDDEGIGVEVVPGTCHHLPHICRASARVVQQVSAGTVTVGWGVPAVLLPAVASGERFKFFYVYAGKSFFDVLVPEESPIRTVADLRGKTVGITDLGYGEAAFVRTLLATAELRPDENVTVVKIAERAPAMQAALRAGKVQAIGASVEELMWLYPGGVKARSLIGDYRDLPASGLFVTESTYNDRRDVLVKVARAVARATLFSLTNPGATAAIMARAVPQQFQNADAGRLLLRTYLDLSTPLRKDDRGEPIFGHGTREGWERLQKMVLAKPVDLTPVVANELVEDINRFDRQKVREQARAFRAP